MQTDASIANKNIIDLLEIKVDVIMVVRVLSLMLFARLFITLRRQSSHGFFSPLLFGRDITLASIQVIYWSQSVFLALLVLSRVIIIGSQALITSVPIEDIFVLEL